MIKMPDFLNRRKNRLRFSNMYVAPMHMRNTAINIKIRDDSK